MPTAGQTVEVKTADSTSLQGKAGSGADETTTNDLLAKVLDIIAGVPTAGQTVEVKTADSTSLQGKAGSGI